MKWKVKSIYGAPKKQTEKCRKSQKSQNSQFTRRKKNRGFPKKKKQKNNNFRDWIFHDAVEIMFILNTSFVSCSEIHLSSFLFYFYFIFFSVLNIFYFLVVKSGFNIFIHLWFEFDASTSCWKLYICIWSINVPQKKINWHKSTNNTSNFANKTISW